MSTAEALSRPVPAGRSAAALARWAGALGVTGYAMLRASLADDPAPHVSAWSRRLLAALGIEVTWSGEPAACPFWVSNHLSWLDPLVLLAARPMGTLAKAEVASYPIIGRAAARAGIRFVQREDATSRAAALAALKGAFDEGRPMLLFPEGTTTRGDRLAPLRPGGLLAAHALGLPTQPLCITSEDAHYPWVEEDELLPHLDGLARRGATRVTVRVGPLLHPSDHPDPLDWLTVLHRHLHP